MRASGSNVLVIENSYVAFSLFLGKLLPREYRAVTNGFERNLRASVSTMIVVSIGVLVILAYYRDFRTN